MLALSADRKVNPGALNIDGVDWSGVFIGPDPIGLGGFEVAVATSDHTLSPAEIRQLHKLRLDGRDTNLVVAVVFGDNVTLFGPDPSLLPRMQPLSAAERKLQAALNEPDTSQAMRRFLALSDSESSGQMAGVRNRGLFASYHLRENVSKRTDWSEMMDRSEKLLDSRGRQLIEDLGFTIAEQANDAFVLADSSDESRAVALLLDDSEFFDHESPRFHSSPVAWGLGIAAEKGLPWLIMLRHEQIRLYPAKDGVGVGQKGQTETYLELDLAGIAPAYYGLLSLIFSASALAQEGTAQQLLEESNRYATELGVRLRDRIYSDVVPDLARAVANQMKSAGHELDSKGLQDAYRTTLRILFRILFQAYAEDRGLLPLERNPHFYEKSLTAFAKAFLEGDASYGEGTGLWDTLQDVWTAIDEGNPEWSVPAYNGGLFGSDPERRPYGAIIKSISLPDSVVGPALSKLLVDQSGDGVLGMIDFRSLSVREFGTIYEGLLESSLSLADTDLTLDANGVWLPAQDGDMVEAKAGEPYFHNTSGERKATGSYFTPDFIVDHLIERAIDPTLDAHLERISALLQEGKHAEAAKNFFDYRVADIAMGSAHFLVAAVDRIESKMRTFLAAPENAIPGVKNELERLAEAARVALGSDLVAIEDIDEAVLLRRQIARRCIYGIDINPLAVELARLAIWIHTFVPGLPMSSLDHNLAIGNSAIGVSDVEELITCLFENPADGQLDFQGEVVRDVLNMAAREIASATAVGEATVAEVLQSRDNLLEAEQALKRLAPIFDFALAIQSGLTSRPSIYELDALEHIAQTTEATGEVQRLSAAHFPLLFPEVFSRENPGFDAMVGNPPWEKLHVDKVKWWMSRFPSLRKMKGSTKTSEISRLTAANPALADQLAQEVELVDSAREIIHKKGWKGIGKSHIDLYQVFGWLNWKLLRLEGVIGIVLPRGAMSGVGTQAWREEIFQKGSFSSAIFAKNSGGWAFPSVAHQVTFTLAEIRKGSSSPLTIWRPIQSAAEFPQENQHLGQVGADELRSWSRAFSFPTFESPESLDVYRKMSAHPKLSKLPIRVKPSSEFNSTLQKNLFNFEESSSLDPVVAGRTFNLWTPNAGLPFAGVERSLAESFLFSRLKRPKNSEEVEPEWRNFRIFFRDIARSTDPRTVICSLLPPNSFSLEGSPYLSIQPYSAFFQAYLLSVMSSIPFDWTARRWVELHVKFYIIEELPIPIFDKDSTIHRRLAHLAILKMKNSDGYLSWVEAVRDESGLPIEGESSIELEEIDALTGLAYGLSSQEIVQIFETFHRGWDYQPRLEKVLDFYRQWEDKA